MSTDFEIQEFGTDHIEVLFQLLKKIMKKLLQMLQESTTSSSCENSLVEIVMVKG